MINKDKVKNCIEKIENKTRAEIVPAILKSSDKYPATYYRSGLFFSSFFFITSFLIFHEWRLKALIVGYILGLLLCFIPFVKRLFIFRPELEEETLQKAYEVFLEHKIHQTKNRSGVLVFLSVFEKRAIILADKNINEVVAENTWIKKIDLLIEEIHEKSLEEGFLNCLNDVGAILIQNFPGNNKNENELRDDLVSE